MLDTPIKNAEIVATSIPKFWWQAVSNASFTVDLFFAFSGFFLSFVALKKLSTKMGFWKSVFLATLYRLLRIWPLYTAVFLFTWKIVPLFGDGPIFGLIFNNEIDSCYSQWPFMLTFLTNWTYGWYEKVAPVCLGWYWYIPNDFQMSIIGTILIAIYVRSKRKFYFSFLGVFSIGFILESWKIWTLGIGPNIFQQGSIFDNFKDYYIILYNRGSPFLIGLLFGVLYHEYKKSEKADNPECKIRSTLNKIKSSFLIRNTVFFGGIFLMLFVWFVLYDSYKHKWSYFWDFTYLILSRKVFIIGLFMFCIVLMLGRHKTVSQILSSKVLSIPAKLSFASYLIHPVLIKFTYYSMKQSFYFDPYMIFVYSVFFMTLSNIISCFASPLFESPFGNLRIFFESGQKKSQDSNQKQ